MSASLKRLACALALSIFCRAVFAQEATAPAPENKVPVATGIDEAQKYGLVKRPSSSDITPPVVIHSMEPQFSEEARKKKLGGTVIVSLIVDKEGQPHKMRVLCSPGMGLDVKAVAAVSEYQFKPAMQNGKPIEVELQIRVNFQISRNKKKEEAAEAMARQQAQAVPSAVPFCDTDPSAAGISAGAAAEEAEEAQFGPIKKIGNGVSAPTVTHRTYAVFSEEARRASFNGMAVVSLIVDRQGMPQNVHVIRGVGMGLDEKAVESVRQYRFKPAMEDGQPVAVKLNVEVNFQAFRDGSEY